MKVRFGFVAMSTLLEDASPSKTMTYKTFSKLADREAAVRRLVSIAEQNLHNTLRILKHSTAHDIQMYRLSSKLIPLATHDELQDWKPYAALQQAFKELGDFVLKKRMRASFHPDHFCVFSTPRPEVLINSKKDLIHHVVMLETMGLDERFKCNIHIGGAYGDKESSGLRFIEQFSALSPRYKHRVTLENDDKTFNVKETLAAAEATGVPMVLDIHHHMVNPGDLDADELHQVIWPRISATWERERNRLGLSSEEQLPPKIHASSPKSITNLRGHADYVEPLPLLEFLLEAARTTEYLDCMLEAKSKDSALLQLMEDMRELAGRDERIRIVDGASIEINN